MPIRSGARRFGRANGAAGARLVLDDDWLTERGLQLDADFAREDVGRSSRRKWDDQTNRARRPACRVTANTGESPAVANSAASDASARRRDGTRAASFMPSLPSFSDSHRGSRRRRPMTFAISNLLRSFKTLPTFCTMGLQWIPD